MNKKLITEIGNLIRSFNKSLELHLLALEKEVQQLIDTKSVDTKIIENYLDTLLGLATMHRIGEMIKTEINKYLAYQPSDVAELGNKVFDHLQKMGFVWK